ncbi:MAG: hypothetical protein ACKOBD_08920 [Chloroflexota bacterium]
MKTKNIFSACIFLLVILTLLLVMVNFDLPSVAAKDMTINTVQVTPTPPVEDSSEIGSTEGILIMGIVIVLIVTLPLVFQKRK